MDWKECLNKRIAKDVKTDINRIKSIKKISNQIILSANLLSNQHYYAKISLLYEALRGYLESIALKNGFKIYNHECYTSFLKEILNMPNKAARFDKLRKIRNGINYYGKTFSLEEGEFIIEELKVLIKIFKEVI